MNGNLLQVKDPYTGRMADELIAHDQAEANEGLESQEFREALLNGISEENKKVIKMVDNRFTAHVRRIRQMESNMRSQGRDMERLANAQDNQSKALQQVLPIVDDVRLIKRVIVWVGGGLAFLTLAAGTVTAVAGALRVMGVI